jgi:hypothetical protein
MTSISETGHAKNVSNFDSLISSVIAFGQTYNPSKESIKLPALQNLQAVAKNSLNELYTAQANYSNAVAARDKDFEPLSKLVTRIFNSLRASDSSEQADKTAQTIVRKLQGRRASVKISDEEKKALEVEGKEVNQISASQMSYDSRIENFGRLISLLSTIQEYNPNEEDLKLETLKELQTKLIQSNKDVVLASISLSNNRINRNAILYSNITGLVDIAFDSKIYIKSVYGAASPQFKQVSRLYFKTRVI